MGISELSEQYIAKDQKVKKLKAKAEDFRLKIERLEKRVDKLSEDNWWGDMLIRPIMIEIKKTYPTIVWDDESLIALGLRNSVSVFGKIEGQTIVHLTFTPYDLDNGIIAFDCAKKEGNYAHPNSIYMMNGMGNIQKPLTSIQELVDYIHSEISKLVNG